jgi:hypothetical protein
LDDAQPALGSHVLPGSGWLDRVSLDQAHGLKLGEESFDLTATDLRVQPGREEPALQVVERVLHPPPVITVRQQPEEQQARRKRTLQHLGIIEELGFV